MTNPYYNPTTLSRFTLARSGEVNAQLQGIAVGFALLPDPTKLKLGTVQFGSDVGAANAYVITLPYLPSAYTDGMLVDFIAANANTQASTIDLTKSGGGTVGAVPLKRFDGSDLQFGDIPAGSTVSARFKQSSNEFRVLIVPLDVQSATDWATLTGSDVNGSGEYSAKEYAVGTFVPAGSSKRWATSTTTVAGGLKGAKGYADDASSSAGSANSSAAAASSSQTSAAASASSASTSATNASSSASAASTSETNAAASAAAAAASAASINIPALAGHSGEYILVNGTEDGFDFTPTIPWSNITGVPSATAPVANTLAARDSDGYLRAVYFNQTSPDSENPASIDQVFVQNPNDTYLRKASLSYFQTKLSIAWSQVTGTPIPSMSGQALKYPQINGAGSAFQYITAATLAANIQGSLSIGWSQVTGVPSSVSATANTLLLRDGSGDAFARYLNQGSSNSENPTVSQIMVTNGDNYLRKASLAHLKSQLAITAANVIPSAYDSIGAYVFAMYTSTGTSWTAGTVVSGSVITPTNANPVNFGDTLPGTWRVCGHTGGTTGFAQYATLFQRVT